MPLGEVLAPTETLHMCNTSSTLPKPIPTLLIPFTIEWVSSNQVRWMEYTQYLWSYTQITHSEGPNWGTWAQPKVWGEAARNNAAYCKPRPDIVSRGPGELISALKPALSPLHVKTWQILSSHPLPGAKSVKMA